MRVLVAAGIGIERDLVDLELRLGRDDVNEMTPAERQLLSAHVFVLRRRLREGLAGLGVRLPGVPTGIRARSSTTLDFIGIHLADLRPKALRGYGALDAAMADALERFVADLTRSVRLARATLDDGASDLDVRATRLGGEVGTLAATIAREGLVELRGNLRALIERLEADCFEVAIFGRVSSGKSSLLNAFLGMTVLPVGALPVTSVPTRIMAGDRGTVRVGFPGEEEVAEHALERLSDFVTEERNPDNRLHVDRVTVIVPSPRLPASVALVDTPGIGSIAASGARETYSYLPRCDLGIVAVPAGGALERDDLDVIGRLHLSGIAARVVVTKADLLAPPERMRFCEYVRTKMRSMCGVDMPVDAVSTIGPDASLAEAWFARELTPLFAAAQAARRAATDRRLALLRAAADVAVSSRSLGVLAARDPRLDVIVGKVSVLLDQTAARCHELASGVGAAELTSHVLHLAAERLLGDEGATLATILHGALAELTDGLARAVEAELIAARDRTRALVEDVAAADGGVTIELDLLTLPSVRDPQPPAIRGRRWPRRFLGGRARLEHALVEAAASSIADALTEYIVALRAWSRSAIERLAEQAFLRLDALRSVASDDRVDRPMRVSSRLS